jgi:hypothetical protein
MSFGTIRSTRQIFSLTGTAYARRLPDELVTGEGGIVPKLHFSDVQSARRELPQVTPSHGII